MISIHPLGAIGEGRPGSDLAAILRAALGVAALFNEQ
jgi:hypothetical protein